MRAKLLLAVCILVCGIAEGEGKASGARHSADIFITNPQDLSISEPTFPLSFTVVGGDSLDEGTMAVALLNNREVVNITLNGTSQQSFTIQVNELAQMTYDLTIILQGAAGNYLGVYNMTSFGVIGGPQPPLDESGKESIWTADEIRERLKRRTTVDAHMREHADDIMALAPREGRGRGGEGGREGGREGGDGAWICDEFWAAEGEAAVRMTVGLLLAFEGRAHEAAACLPPSPIQGHAVPLPHHILSPSLSPSLFAAPSVFSDSISGLHVIRDLHLELYQQMRAASPGDPAMGMEGTSGQVDMQTQLYHTLAQSPSLKTFCETGFGAGHSTLNWLASNPDSRVLAFDLGELKGADVGEAYVKAKFPGRFELIRGDSSWTVPETLEARPDLRCDVVHVDGGHFDFVPWNDLIELAKASHTKTLVLVDDTPSIGDVARAMAVAGAAAIFNEVGCWNTVGYDDNTKGRHLRGFCLGFYDPAALEAIKAYGG